MKLQRIIDIPKEVGFSLYDGVLDSIKLPLGFFSWAVLRTNGKMLEKLDEKEFHYQTDGRGLYTFYFLSRQVGFMISSSLILASAIMGEAENKIVQGIDYLRGN